MSFEPIFTFQEKHGRKFKYQCNLCPDKQTITWDSKTNNNLKRHLKNKHSKEDQRKFNLILKKINKKTRKMENPDPHGSSPEIETFEIEKIVDPTNEKMIKN